MPETPNYEPTAVAPEPAIQPAARTGGVRIRLTLGPALIEIEATLEEIVIVATRLTQEYAKAGIIGSVPA